MVVESTKADREPVEEQLEKPSHDNEKQNVKLQNRINVKW